MPPRSTPIVLLDTNALLLSFSSPLRWAVEVERAIGRGELRVPSSVLGELRRLRERGVRNAHAAEAVAARFPVVPTGARGDAGVIEAARRESAWVLTGDRALRDRLRRLGVPVLFPRGRSGLVALLALAPATVKKRARLDSTGERQTPTRDRRRPSARRPRPRVRERGHRGLRRLR